MSIDTPTTETSEAVSRASSACPICGKDSPHHHSLTEVEEYRLELYQRYPGSNETKGEGTWSTIPAQTFKAPENLKVCPNPWCGNQAFIAGTATDPFYGPAFQGLCTQCGLAGPVKRTKDEAITAWNTRPTGKNTEAAVAEAVERTPVAPADLRLRRVMTDHDWGWEAALDAVGYPAHPNLGGER